MVKAIYPDIKEGKPPSYRDLFNIKKQVYAISDIYNL